MLKEALLYKKELVYANLIAFLSVLVSTPVPLLIPILVDEVLLDKPLFVVPFINSLIGKSEAYVYVVIVLFVVIALRSVFYLLNYVQTKLFTIISKNITYKIRKELLEHLSKVSLNRFEFLGSGNVSSLLVVDIDTIDNFLGTLISRLIISILTILGVGVILLLIHWQLALFIMCLNPVVVVLTTKIARKVSVYKKEQNKSYEIFTQSLNETLDLFMQIKSANKENYFFGNVVKNADDLRVFSIKFGYKSDAASRFSFLIFLSGFELFRAASILVVAYSDLSIGLMFGIFGYLWVMMTPIQEIINMQYAYHNAKAALTRINTIFALEQEPQYNKQANPFLEAKTNSLHVRDLLFAYEENKPILDIKSLHVPKGKKVAIVGASGSGKTTLAQLLVGLYPLDRGDILFDNVSLRDIGLDVIRDHVYLVLQNPQLFNDTMLKNLTLGTSFSEEQLHCAIKIAQLQDFVASLQDGLETQIGKHGIKLSGGQRQRLSIARMVLQNPNIVILDESTSALDVHTETRLFDALETYLADKTTIIIAHRLSTIRKADYIYVLDHGTVIEEGTSKELMAQEGVFFSYIQNK
ncbi:MAG: ABC transporter ATP-binding protein [Sulfurospirillum sp.]|nr:ABC transporter ATP-binding protein [Sulfurospirillum sp.]